MTPEEKARRDIDRQLEQCGWLVQDRAEMNISAGPGVAVREFPMITGEADYLLYADGKAIGVVEAKPAGAHPDRRRDAVGQVRRCPPDRLPAHRLPLPFCYESTGAVTQFTNLLEPDARSREVFTFHRPEELLRLVGSTPRCGQAPEMPPLDAANLGRCRRRPSRTWRSRSPEQRPAP